MEAEEPSPLVWGGRHLLRWCGQRMTRQIESADCVPSTARLRVNAAAEFTYRAQEAAFLQVLSFAKDMITAQAWRPICFLEHGLYDETPLHLVIQYQGDETADKQVAKTFVVEAEWAMLFELLPSPLATHVPPRQAHRRFFSLRGRFSPAVRAAAATDGETIHQLLHTQPTTCRYTGNLSTLRQTCRNRRTPSQPSCRGIVA